MEGFMMNAWVRPGGIKGFLLLASLAALLMVTLPAQTAYGEILKNAVIEEKGDDYIVAGGIKFSVPKNTPISNRHKDRISFDMLDLESSVNISYTSTGGKKAKATWIQVVKDAPG